MGAENLKNGLGKRTSSTVEETVTGLDGVVDGIGGNGVVDFPQAETDLGHVVAAAQLDVRNVDHLDDFTTSVCVSGSRLSWFGGTGENES